MPSPLGPATAAAARGDCGQPASDGARPVATDALTLLRVAVALDSCDLCVCDVDSSGKVLATDALLVLRFAVNQPGVVLACISCVVCGDGDVGAGEECDDGASNSDSAPDACRSDCRLASCGDGVVDSGEDCEPPGSGACNPLCLACAGADEVCNGVDDDCDTATDEDLGQVTCGIGPCEVTVDACTDGTPTVCTPGPPQPEVCDDGIDQDCDGSDCVALALDLNRPASDVARAAGHDIRGTADARITEVRVNGQTATLPGDGTFQAHVELEPGPNMIVAVGSDGMGNQGVDSYEITLDTIAPSIAINSPPEGFTTSSDKVTVTGVVADLIDGGRRTRVFVAGREAEVSGGSFVLPDVELTQGTNTLRAEAVDAAGNRRATSIQVRRREMAGIRVRAVSGDAQAAMTGETLPAPLVVEITDEFGSPLAGRMVTFEVTRNDGSLAAGDRSGLRSIDVATGATGRASVSWTLGSSAGSGNNRVRAFSPGVQDEVLFCASGLVAGPDKLLEISGNNQTGQVGEPLAEPFEVLVVDADSNPVGDLPVQFAVLQGAGTFNGEPSLLIRTDDTGIARAVLTLGPATGTANNVAEVSFGAMTTQPAIFLASALAGGDEAETRFEGVVLDNAGVPIPRVAAVAPGPDGNPVFDMTDDSGRFLIEDVAVGRIELEINPSTTTRPEVFPPISFQTVTVAGRTNSLPTGPIRLPELVDGGRLVGGDEDVVVEMPGVPGMQITVAANSATFPDGSPTGVLSLNQVHGDKIPMPPPSGGIFLPPAWTLQPAGVAFDPPARVQMPNNGLAPGYVVEIYQFDHDIGRFVSVGPATVTEDGQFVVSDPGFGVVRTGWGGATRPRPPTTCAASCDDHNECTTDTCVSGTCRHTPANEGGSCTGSVTDCQVKVCRSGACLTEEMDCDDEDPCTVDLCSGNQCFHDPVGEGGMCDNGKQCVDGICEDGECVDSLDFPNGRPCDDGDGCTQMDMCDLGICEGMDIELSIDALVEGAKMTRRPVDCSVAFTADIDTNCKGSLVVTWDFGDGFTGGGTSTSHKYLTLGTYTATATAICGSCSTEFQDSVTVKATPVVDILDVTPVADTKLGEDTVIRYRVQSIDSQGFDNVRLEIRNRNDEIVVSEPDLPHDPGTYTYTWSQARWNAGVIGTGPFANPANNPYIVRVIGTLDGCESMDTDEASTRFIIEFDVEDKPGSVYPPRSSGLGDLGDALKVALVNGGTERVLSGMSLAIAGVGHESRHVTVDHATLNGLGDGVWDVEIRDMRDAIGNFFDDNGNPDDGFQPKKFQVDLE